MTAPRKSTLDNGIRVVTEAMPEVRSVSIGFWVGVGSRDEEPRFGGATHFLEHLLFKGTDSRTALEIAESMDAVGGDLNAFTTKEFTCYYARALDDDRALAFDILIDITRNPTFPKSEVEIERGVILEEIRAHEDDPGDVAHELFYHTLWPEHPLGRPILGSGELVAGMDRDEISAYFRTHYLPENLVIAAAGNIDHDEVVERIEAGFDGLTGGRPRREMTPAVAGARIGVISRPSEQAHLLFGMLGLAHQDEDRYALTVLNHILGGGMSSRLFQEIREKRGLAYSVYSYKSLYDETGTFGVYAGTNPTQAREVIDLIETELAKLLKDGVTEIEIERARGHLKGSLALGHEDSGSRMSRIGRGELVANELLTVDDLVARVDAVSRDDVNRVAERVIGADDRVLAVVGPFEANDFDDIVG